MKTKAEGSRMLELIVLGQVPGTHLVITFNWLLVIMASGLLVYEVIHIVKRRANHHHNDPTEIAL